MKIAVIGAGNVGGTLGRRWAQKGHEVLFGVQDPTSDRIRQVVAAAGASASAASVETAAQAAPIVVYATPWSATEIAIKASGNLAGKTIIDCTNPLTPDFSELAAGFVTSGAEMIAAWAVNANVYKTFNQTGWENMADPAYPNGPCVMLVCGPEGSGKQDVLSLVKDIGFEAIDAGELKIARLLEPFGMVWIHLAINKGLGRDWAFQLVRRG